VFRQLPCESFISRKLILLSRRWTRRCSLGPWRLDWRCWFCSVWVGHACDNLSSRQNSCRMQRNQPSRALKAGSTFPPLARKTALTTAASMEGNASLSVFSACCSGANGRGGFGGATSSTDAGCEKADGWSAFGGGAGVSIGSSSKSNALAVVGDSGRSSSFYNNLSAVHLAWQTDARSTYRFSWICHGLHIDNQALKQR